jgi:DNA-binding FadR family transcriptional regulator
LHQEVRRRVRDYIVHNGLGPGDRLPTETEIAEQLSVSRNVVREALKGLEALGLVEVRKGSGTHVSRFDAAKYLEHYTHSLIVNGIGIDELWEVRRALELAFIGKAAAAIGDDDLKELDGLVTAMEQAPENGESPLSLGLRIHQVIYRCLNNHVLAGLMDAIAEFYARVWSPIREPLTPAELARDVEIHRRLVAALRRHDADAAQSVLARELAASPSAFVVDRGEK